MGTTRLGGHTAGLLVILATTTALATACHSASTSAAPRAEAVALCRTATLTMSVNTGQAGGAAGSTYYPIDFTNTSGTACSMAGYPGVSFVTAAGRSGRQIGAAAQRNQQFGSVLVRLRPGGRAHAWLQVAEVGNYPEATCHPTSVPALRVYPPDETAAGYVLQDFTACAAPGTQQLTVMPVRGGNGTRGSTP
jgi:hypothetical protein